MIIIIKYVTNISEKMQLEVNNIKNLSTKHRGITAQIVM
jgi:hypothetical protein